jgi:endonuclease/exonuclease/phosphatase family metal-dependent hydrolase
MPTCSRVFRTTLFAVATVAGSIVTAGAQTTLVLNAPGTQVTDTMVQAGSSANTNFNKSEVLATRASVNSQYLRRALIKFDTQNTIPAKSRVQSAIMTLTLKIGGADAKRAVSVFPVTMSFVEEEATWNRRRGGIAWTSAGGDLGRETLKQVVTNKAGAKVTFDVTALVQAAVSGASSSRYTRLALADLGASTSASYREYYSSQALDPSVRPMLTVVYGASTPVSKPPVVTSPVVTPPTDAQAPHSGVTLRVLQYNTHHGGYGSDGVYSVERIVDWIVKTNADLVSLNEVEVNDSWSKGKDQTVIYRDLLQQKTHKTWYKVYFNRSGAASGIGQLILSTYPFIATAGQTLPGNRSAVNAMIDVNGRTINFVSVHLDNEQQSNRLKQVAQLLPWATTLAEQRIVAGDYNAWPETSEIAKMKAEYHDTWLEAQAKKTAVGNGITHGSHRIDYIFKSKSAAFLNLVSVQTFNTADAKGVRPSDHEPVLAVFEVR